MKFGRVRSGKINLDGRVLVQDIPSSTVRRGKIAVLKKKGGNTVFFAREHKQNLHESVKKWSRIINGTNADYLLNVSGLTMSEQRNVATLIKEEVDHQSRKRITVDDGPYEASARMVEEYIRG